MGSKMNCSNYIPISLLSSFSKIFEKIVYKRVYTYLLKFKLLSINRFGFQYGVSTSDAISALYDDLLTMQIKSITVVDYFWTYQKLLTLLTIVFYYELSYQFGIRERANKFLKVICQITFNTCV